MPEFLTKRAGFWHYARRVPLAYADLDPRGVIRQSTKIRVADDPRAIRAQRAAERINGELEAFWRAAGTAEGAEAKARYDRARRDARRLGFPYITAVEVAQLPIAEILARFDVVAAAKPDDHAVEAAALGTVEPPALDLDGLFDEFEALMKPSLKGMSDDQVRRWQSPKKRAIANLRTVIGNKALAKLTRVDALDFQRWWIGRIEVEGVEIETANKDIGHLNKMLGKVENTHRLGLGPVFSQLRIEGGRTGQRTAFAPAYVQNTLLADGALAMLNPEARRILYLIAETGLRLSEACNLTAETIRLDDATPHVQVRPDGRRMKTEQSERDIPLVGVALMAMREHPEGFPRYRDQAAGLSAAVNKTLRENGLLPSEGHTVYSLRHTFEDRLTAVEAPDKIAAALMGHKYRRPRYGVGPSLAQKAEWLQRIAFRMPGTV
ncbi:tyrosine-type recombinase/integrase [Methylobacterium sp. NEAU 140]|uniref:tyrosine-type recombinase/integrase n=1 Tax=Methylobacterium sp. NEAU 140 TaxID=3064945 RepID=UPI0027347D64|nr:tyrosine-type recombinase/integrase [Methylobacterium sp. NEAU 140]MDP4024425.1 tyrosine-type recombinase/integrase [Methylobacterium sp. NEAU 140]